MHGPAADGAGPEGTRLPRFREQLPLRIGADSARGFVGFSTDVSARGLGFEASFLPRAGQHVFVSVTLPEGRVAKIEGRVVWTRAGEASNGMQGRAGLELANADESYFQLVLEASRHPLVLP